MLEKICSFSHRRLIPSTGFSHRTAYICTSCGWIQDGAADNACLHCLSHQIIHLGDRLRHDFDKIHQQKTLIAQLKVRLTAALARNNRTTTKLFNI